jgi:ABC-type taurine transport system ATPase subunit
MRASALTTKSVVQIQDAVERRLSAMDHQEVALARRVVSASTIKAEVEQIQDAVERLLFAMGSSGGGAGTLTALCAGMINPASGRDTAMQCSGTSLSVGHTKWVRI